MNAKQSKVKGGCTLWARQTIDSTIFANKPAVWFKIFFFIVTRSCHANSSKLRRGQCHLTYDTIMLKCGATKAQVDHCMRWLRKKRMCATLKATRGFIVTVLNYERYQTFDTYKSDSNGDSKAIQKRQDIQECKEGRNNILAQFDIFWQAYPRKQGKAAAQRWWMKNKPDEQLLQTMLEAVKAQTGEKEFKQRVGAFCPEWPYGSTWLNGKRWEDEVDTNQQPAAAPLVRDANGMTPREAVLAQIESEGV